MTPPQEQPIHWDKHKTNLNITLMLALIIAVFGVVTGFQPVPIIAGLGIAAYERASSLAAPAHRFQGFQKFLADLAVRIAWIA